MIKFIDTRFLSLRSKNFSIRFKRIKTTSSIFFFCTLSNNFCLINSDPIYNMHIYYAVIIDLDDRSRTLNQDSKSLSLIVGAIGISPYMRNNVRWKTTCNRSVAVRHRSCRSSKHFARAINWGASGRARDFNDDGSRAASDKGTDVVRT